jgi:flavin-dependent dehydrogenase
MPATSTEILIVGGGPAGLTAALALVDAAPSSVSRVVVLEKGRYPRDKYCAGALGARGDKILARLGAVPDVPSVPIDGISFRGAGGEIAASPGGIGRVVRRKEFDHALAEIARGRGIEVRDGVRVDSVTPDPNGDGALVATSEGPRRACVVVGADGVGSVVRKAMGLGAGELRAQVLEVDTESVAGDRDRRLLHFDAADMGLTGYTWDFPTVVRGQALVCRGIYRLKLAGSASRDDGAEVDIRRLLAERLAAMGLDLDRYENKRFAERGFDPVERSAAGPLMLVGEAAGIDPVTGEGIAQAIESGALAGRFLARTRDVAAWNREVARSRIAIDLRIRRGVVPFFYGAGRPHAERFLLASPDFLHVGAQHFGAQPHDPGKLAKSLARAGATFVTGGLLQLAFPRVGHATSGPRRSPQPR